jgi:hypothetical protein
MSGFIRKSKRAVDEPTLRSGRSICISRNPSRALSGKSPGWNSAPRSRTHTRKPARARRLAATAPP